MLTYTKQIQSKNRPDYLRLGQMLCQRSLITRQQLDIALNYQQQHACRLGEALVILGFINQKNLDRSLWRQYWLTPYAVCALAFGSVPAACAGDPQEFSADWAQVNQWNHVMHESLNKNSETLDVVKLAATFGWQMYEGEQKAGDVRFSLKNPKDDVFTLQVSMRF